MSLYEVPAITLFGYHQFPLWNPYSGGGISLIGNPQAGFLSPIFLLTVFFGVPAGLKLAVWLHTFLGLWGMWLLSDYIGIAGPARLAPPIIFMFSGAWALHLAAGHIVWLPAALLPFFFLTVLKSLGNGWWMLVAAAVESLMFYEGGTYVLAFSLLLVLVYLTIVALEKRTLQPWGVFVMVNVLAALLSAPKLLPVIELLRAHPRPTGAGSSLPMDIYLSFFTDRFRGIGKRLNGTGWWEFGSYIGIAVITLYLFSYTLFRRHLALLMSSLFLMLLSMGNFGSYSPWRLLHELPLLSGFKVPTRILIVFCFTVALLAGKSLSHLGRDNFRGSQLLVAALLLYIFADLASVSFPTLFDAQRPITTPYWTKLRRELKLDSPQLYNIPPSTSASLWQSVESIHHPFQQVSVPFDNRNAHGAWSDQYRPLLKNIGVVDAYETIPFTRYALAKTDSKYKGEYFLTEPGVVSLKRWTPNQLQFDVQTNSRNQLVINQNFADGWQSSYGHIYSHHGLLAARLPSGEYQLEIFYIPNSFKLGLFLFSITTCGLIIITSLRVFRT